MPRRELAGGPSEARERMWRAMRVLRQFRMRELLQVAEVPRKAAEKYLRGLTRANYLRVTEHARGCDGNLHTLIRNTGPFAPRIGRKGLLALDPNLEITRIRELRANLMAQITACDKRLARLGAFVERQKQG